EPGVKRLVAYIVAEGERQVASDQLRIRLAAKLPDFMVPAAIIQLDQLPMTPHGKLDRSRLPAMQTLADKNYRPPNSERERILCRLLAELTHSSCIGLDDNYFQLGGDSIGS